MGGVGRREGTGEAGRPLGKETLGGRECLLHQPLRRPKLWGCGFHIAGPFPSPARCFIPKTFQKVDSEMTLSPRGEVWGPRNT